MARRGEAPQRLELQHAIEARIAQLTSRNRLGSAHAARTATAKATARKATAKATARKATARTATEARTA